jgi:hypothetical protein
MITNISLRKNKYSIKELEYALKSDDTNLNLFYILKTQTLTPEFCVKYLLSEKYASSVEETYISSIDILQHQPHINSNILGQLYNKYITNGTF